MKEEERVLQTFVSAFEETKQIPRALYGIGVNTKYILEQVQGYHILALMDQNNEGQTIYGLPVKSPESLLGSVQEIVIITRFVSLNIVYQRIKHLEAEGIVIKGPDGALLSQVFAEDKLDYSQFPYPKEEELLKKIESASVVSFDMFDTLVQRTVLHPEDVFKLVEEKSGEKDFASQRIKAQKESLASLGVGRSFDQIYEVFQKNTKVTTAKREALKKLELELEYACIIPRKSGVALWNHCKKQNKTLYILSDMYLSQGVLEQLLAKNGIDGYVKCIVSCEEAKTKESGALYHVLKEEVGEQAILHIGDNLKADVLNAQENGLDSFHFMSYPQLLANSPFFTIYNQVTTCSDSVLVGHIFSDLLDSPFALTNYQGRCFVENLEQLAKLSITPLLLKFLSWEWEKLEHISHPRVFYLARDGYLLYEIHKALRTTQAYQHLPPCDYVYASRRGLLLPNVATEEDILALAGVDAMQTMENIREVIEERFGWTIDLCQEFGTLPLIQQREWVENHLLERKEEIFSKASQEKQEYLAYLETFALREEETLFLFDLATRGTLKNNFNKMTQREGKSLCFATINQTDPCESDYALFGNTTFYGSQRYGFFTSFMSLETLLASEDGQFIAIKEGKPLFRREAPPTALLSSLQDILKEETIKWFETQEVTWINQVSLSLVDGLYGCLQDKFCVLSQKLKPLFLHEDPFSKRTEHLFDVISMKFDQ